MAVVWGIPFLLIRVAVRDVSPVTLVFLRTAVSGVLLVPLALGRGEFRPLLPRWRPLIAYTAVEIALPWLLLSDAERRLTSSISGLLVATVPLVGTVLARLMGDRGALAPVRLAGLGVGLAGVAALVGFDIGRGDLGSVGEVFVIAVCYAVGPMIIARRLSGLPVVGVVAASLGLCAVGYAPAGLTHLPVTVPPAGTLAAIASLGAVCSGIGFLLFFALIAEVGPVRATVVSYLNPAVAVLLGALILSEPVTAATLVGFVLILAGSFLATRPVGGDRARARLREVPAGSARAGRP